MISFIHLLSFLAIFGLGSNVRSPDVGDSCTPASHVDVSTCGVHNLISENMTELSEEDGYGYVDILTDQSPLYTGPYVTIY